MVRELGAVDRLSTLACQLLLATCLLCSSLAGISEAVVRFRAAANANADALVAPVGPAASVSPPPATDAMTASFACVAFVCVNRSSHSSHAIMVDYASTSVAAFRTYTTFSECVQHCVVTSPSSAASRMVSLIQAQPTAYATATASTPAPSTTPVPNVAPAAPGNKKKRKLPPMPSPSPSPSTTSSAALTPGTGLVRVSNASLDKALTAWLDARHRALPCSTATPVYFAPMSPNGIGNKLMAVVMAFHMALMQGRRLVVSDWPPRTLATSYALDQVLQPSSCQALFDDDSKRRRPVQKCTVIACPLRVSSAFQNAYTQPHWAHMSSSFLDLPREWAHLEWLTWWRAITQYLLRPGVQLMGGLARTLSRVKLLRSPDTKRPASSADTLERLHRATPAERAVADVKETGFARRFATGVASWRAVARPLIGVHVRLGDGCWDSKRGGCKYVRSFEAILTRLREAGITRGTIFLATDNATIAAQAVGRSIEGFEVLALGEDRNSVEKSHAKGERRKEQDELLHLQLLDLALLSQADVIAGVFGSTFVKTALQLGNAAAYASLDTFPWCPLLRCFWGWRDMCHNCELCYNSGGGGEACGHHGYHTAGGLRHALRDTRRDRAAFRSFIGAVERDFRCKPFAEHPLGATMYDRPVVGSAYAPPLPAQPRGKPEEVCSVGHLGSGTDSGAGSGAGRDSSTCRCGFRRFHGVDNAAFADRKPAFGYGHARVPMLLNVLKQKQLQPGAGGGGLGGSQVRSLGDCERACCNEPLCHSVVWRANASTCIASLAIAHGARPDDWCWHPTSVVHVTSSIRLPGAWEQHALREAQAYLAARTLVRRGPARGPRVFTKRWSSPAGHTHPMERTVIASSCAGPGVMAGYGNQHAVSDVVAGGAPFEPLALSCDL